MLAYSFQDVVTTFSHPLVGQFTANGAGIGEIDITMATDKTAHDVAADGSVMVSKVLGDNGTIAIQVQQTSSLQQWLLNAYNTIKNATPDQWALMTIRISSLAMQDLHNCTGVSYQQIAERVYQADGQKLTWNLMAASITQTVQ